MRKFAAVAIAALALAGCGSWRETRQRTEVFDGHKFLCSYTHNNISGNESEQQCIPFPEDDQP